MHRKKGVVLVIVLMLIGALSAGCATGGGGAAAPEPAPEPAPAVEQDDSGDAGGFIVKDMTGREVWLPGPAASVVALTAADVEILFAIGAGSTLVGRGEYCNYPPEALDVQSVQSGFETNIEQIIELQPDLLIMSMMGQTQEQVQQLESAGIACFVTDAQTIDEVYVAMDMLGQLVGKESEAAALAAEMKGTLTGLRENAEAADIGKKSIYFEVSPLEYGLWTAGTGTFMDEVALLLGLKNTFGDVAGWGEISEEQVIERNPNFILTVGMYFGDGPTPIESILARQGWGNITAVRDKAILNLTEDELSRPGPRLADGARMLYEFVYEGVRGDF